MIEKILQLVADAIDGKLSVCDDGYTIDIFLPYDIQKEGQSQLCLQFNEGGEYEQTTIH